MRRAPIRTDDPSSKRRSVLNQQTTLFELPVPELPAEPPSPACLELGAQLPPSVRLGTMSWAFPGWRGLVYGRDAPAHSLSRRGLGAYSKHPLLGAVEIDRSYYDPLDAPTLAAYAAQVPSGFRFLVKAHESCVVRRFPGHARYGRKRGEQNPLYLDAAYAAEAVVGPIQSGLGEKLGAILLSFPPTSEPQEPALFAAELGAFLAELPRGVTYAVELRNPSWLGPAYGEALCENGAVHCHNAWSHMPPVLAQARRLPAATRNPLVVRWLLAPGETYEEARERFHPFARIAREDPLVRRDIAWLVKRAADHGVPSIVTINNKAEGCAPESAFRLAEAIVGASA
jgi:uncharacterized protein YecE (DUF72 family)